jgi:hypothetical protein
LFVADRKTLGMCAVQGMTHPFFHYAHKNFNSHCDTDVFADGLQAAFNGIIKGCGRQFIIMPIVVIAYWVVGLPLSYYFAFVQNDGIMECNNTSYFCGDVGLVAGYVLLFLCGLLSPVDDIFP